LWRGRTATGGQQLLLPTAGESPVRDGDGAHGAWEKEGDRCNRVFVPPEGCGADAGLVGKCGRCQCEAHGKMVRCNGCGATFHRVCASLMRTNRPGTKARTGQPWCCLGCELSDGPIAGDPLRISEFCAGTNSLASAFRQLAQAGELRRAYTVVQSVEWNSEANIYTEHLDKICGGGIRAQNALRDLLLVQPDDVKPSHLCLVSLPCASHSSALNGHDVPKGMDHLPTRRIVEHFCSLLRLGLWDLVVFENVRAFYTSAAWEAIVAAGEAAGYRVVAEHTLDAIESGLPQSRARGVRAMSRIGDGEYDLPQCWATLAALEKANALKLDDCLLATTDRAARKRYGITDEVLAGQEVMSAKKRQRLEEIVAAAGTTVEEVTRRDAPAAVIDLGKSRRWANPILGCGHAPTVTASHGPKSLYAPHLKRYLLPIELMMLQGFRDEQLRAAAAAFEPTSRALCRLAGNAIPAEFCLVVVRGLAICYPQLFRDPAAPAEDLRRSARLAGTDAASELWAL
jgi:site-specific DNA-cytosine methylase